MCQLEIDIRPDDSLEEAAVKVRKAYREAGATVLAFEHLNTLLPTSSFCQFFHVELRGERYVAVVSSREWEESSTLAVLNILLNLRMDPEPPGSTLRFRFHGAHAVAPVLLTLFGDGPACCFECRAALVVGYGVDIQPGQCFQLATVATHLLRECFGKRTSLSDPAGEELLAEVMSRWFRLDSFPEGGAPLNSMVALGFLYGELLRSRLPYLSRWVRIRDQSPWPLLAFGAPGAAERRGDGAGAAEGEPPREDAGADGPQIVFNPVATVISVYQGTPGGLLREAGAALAAKCEETLGAFDEN